MEEELKDKKVEDIQDVADTSSGNNDTSTGQSAGSSSAQSVVDEMAGGNNSDANVQSGDNLISKYFSGAQIVDGNVTVSVDDLNSFAEKLKRFEDVNAELVSLISENPEIGGILLMLRQGAPMSEAIARNLDVENLAPMEGEPDYAAWEKGKSGWKEERSKREQAGQALQAELKALVSEDGWTEDEVATVQSFFNTAINDALNGKFREAAKKLKKALDFDAEVENARAEGELATKNAKIDEMKAKKEVQSGDGLPDLGAGGISNESMVPDRKMKFPEREEFRV